MAFTRPTLVQIKDRIMSDLRGGLSLPTILMRSLLFVLGVALSGASHTLHGYIAWAVRQLFPDLADDEFAIRWANIFGLEQLDATFTEIVVTVLGTDGVPVPDTTLFQRSDGFEYRVKTEVTPSGGTVNATLVAVTAGDAGDIANGSVLNITSPITGINSQATVVSTTVDGTDQEQIPDLRTRLLERIQSPPAGGTVADYIAYAKTVVGVTRAWVFPGYLGQGTVAVSFVQDNEDPIIPSDAKVDEVQAAIVERAPIEAVITAFAPIDTPINPIIATKPNSQDVRDAIEAELKDLIFREAQVRKAIDPTRVSDGIEFDGKLPLSKINEAISTALGEDDHVLVFPIESPQPSEGGLLSLGTITFQTLVGTS